MSILIVGSRWVSISFPTYTSDRGWERTYIVPWGGGGGGSPSTVSFGPPPFLTVGVDRPGFLKVGLIVVVPSGEGGEVPPPQSSPDHSSDLKVGGWWVFTPESPTGGLNLS